MAEKEEAQKTKLIYFKCFRARAEPLRMLSQHVGFEYEDQLIAMSDWANWKPKVNQQKDSVLGSEYLLKINRLDSPISLKTILACFFKFFKNAKKFKRKSELATWLQ